MNVTTLNITASALKTMVMQGTALKKQEAPLPPGAVKNGLILQPETMGREIKTMFQNGRLPAGRVVCTVNGLPFTYRILTIPAMNNAAFSEAVLRTAKKEMSISPDEMYLSWQAYPAVNGEYQVLVTGITRRPVDNLIKALKVAGISPWLLDLPHLALARLCPHRDAVIVDFEKDCSNIVMIVDSVPRGMHMVPDIAAGASVQDQVGQVMDRLARMIEFYNGSHPSNPLKEPLKILVTGELLEDNQAMEYIRPQAGYSIELLNSAAPVFAGQSIRSIAVNAGMLNVQPENSKGLPPCHYLDMGDIVREQRPKANLTGILKKSAVPLAVFAGVGLLTLSYLSLGQYREEVTNLQTELTKANTELAQKKALFAQSKLLQTNIDKVASRVNDIKAGQQVISSPRGYVDDVASIVGCLPEKVTIDSLDVDSRGIFLDGIAAEAEPVIEFATNLEKSGDFAKADITWIDRPHDVGAGKQLHFKLVITRG
jgi:Tfp pilus assembly protein PilN